MHSQFRLGASGDMPPGLKSVPALGGRSPRAVTTGSIGPGEDGMLQARERAVLGLIAGDRQALA